MPSAATVGWYSSAEKACFNGLAQNVTFTFSGATVLPNTVYYGVTYDTTHYGSNPIGEGAACFSSSAGCFYDSLNVGITPAGPSVGTSIGTQFGTANGSSLRRRTPATRLPCSSRRVARTSPTANQYRRNRGRRKPPPH